MSSIQDILVEVSEEQGWNEISQLCLMTQFLQRMVDGNELTSNGEPLLRRFREHLQKIVDEEENRDRDGAVCEHCGDSCDYHSELCLCEHCKIGCK